MRKVELRMNELQKYKEIKKLVETNGNKQRAALRLDLSIRQINRLILGYKQYGKDFFVHGNRGRKPKHALTLEFKQYIVDLYTSKYFDCTYTLFSELLAERENVFISIDEVRNILREAYVLSPKAHKCTKKAVKKELKELQKHQTKKAEIKAIHNKIVEIESAHPRQPRCAYFGEEIQMDASLHVWFGKEKYTLHAAIDDSTGKVVGAFFDKQETLKGYYQVTKQMLETYGIPHKIKTDNRTVFTYKKKSTHLIETDTFTQYSYAAKQLGILLETSSVPEFKPRVERLFGTFQNRLNVYLRLEKIASIEEANEYLKTFIPKYNAQFALQEDNTKNVFEKQLDKHKINLTLAILSPRVVDRGHAIQFKKKYYRFVNSRGTPIFFGKGTKCIVLEAFDGSLFATVEENIFALQEIPQKQAFSENFDDMQEIKTKYIYIPKMIHQWKAKSFEEFVKKQHEKLKILEEISTNSL